MADGNNRDPQDQNRGNQQPDRNQQADRQQQGQSGQQRNPADLNNTHQTDTGIDNADKRNQPGGVAGEDQR